MSEVGGVPSGGPAAGLGCYRRLVERYHRTLDLMSDRGLAGIDEKIDDAEAYARAVVAHAAPGTVLDVGSGAGLPGVVVALRCETRRVVLVERRRRRAAFLRLVVAQCGLANVEVVDEDVRTLPRSRVGGPVVAVTAQAVAGLAELYRLTWRLHAERVLLVSRRGATWADDVARAADELGLAPEVVATEGLGRGGTLVVLRAPGGRTCR